MHSIPSPDLENSQLLFLCIISLILSPSLLHLRHPVSFLPGLVVEVSQRISSLKKKKKLVLSSHLPGSFYLWTHDLSIPYGLHMVSTSSALQFILHLRYWLFNTRISVYLCLRYFIFLETVPYVHYFYCSSNWSVFVSFLSLLSFFMILFWILHLLDHNLSCL